MNSDLFSEEKKNETVKAFNAVKNRRRIALLQLLAQRNHSLPELQHGMREHGYDHSQTTILGYLNPLLETGLVESAVGGYSLTSRGRLVREALTRSSGENPLPENSNCDEEYLLLALGTGNDNYEKVFGPTPAGDFSRTVRRLESFGFVRRDKPASRAVYRRVHVEPKGEPSGAEQRIYGLIPDQGVTVQELSQRAAVSVRRTFKYLRTLREKGIVYAEKPTPKLALTDKGKEYAVLFSTIAGALGSRVEATPCGQSPLEGAATTSIDIAQGPRRVPLSGADQPSPAVLAGEQSCEFLRPLGVEGLSGQKLFHCEKHDLTIGENAGICEFCA